MALQNFQVNGWNQKKNQSEWSNSEKKPNMVLFTYMCILAVKLMAKLPSIEAQRVGI